MLWPSDKNDRWVERLEMTDLERSELFKSFIEQLSPAALGLEGSVLQYIKNIKPFEWGLLVTFAADDFGFQEKRKIEKELLQRWAKIASWEIRLNFKRMKVPSDEPSGKKPGASEGSNQKKSIPGVRHLIAVSSAKGGVGKSSVAANLAFVLAAQGFRAGIFDADLHGPSQHLIFAAKGPPQIESEGRVLPIFSLGVYVQSMGLFMDPSKPFASKGPIQAKTFIKLIQSTFWQDLDFLIVDMPPGTGDIHLALTGELRVDGVIIVTTPQAIALADVHKGLSFYQAVDSHVLGVVENMAHFRCRHCHSRENIFGDGVGVFCEERGIPLLGRIPLEADIGAMEAQGTPASSFLPHIREVYDAIALRVSDWS